MVELVKQSMADIWASAGDIVMPDPSKIATGWAVEIVPRQYWNWMQNRVDNNIAYILQHGLPEWDATTEYITNKSYVQHNDVVYKAILTGTNQNPTTATTYWKVAFATSTAALEALKSVTPAADRLPYFDSATTATHTTLTSFARTILDDVDAAAVRTTIGAQPLDATLTAVAGLTTAANKLPYFSGVDTATTTDLTAFGRSLIDDADATAGRTTLGLGTAATATVTTSATDTTANRVLKVGDFGIGTAVISTETDCNAVTIPGVYGTQAGVMTNAPAGFAGRMNLSFWGNTTYGYQVAVDVNDPTSPAMAYRTVRSSVWTPWTYVWTTDGLVKTTSSTDTTAGSMLKVGDFGLGIGLSVATADLNTLTTPGFYYTSNASPVNYPSTLNSGLIIVASGGATNVLTQLFFPIADKTKSYFRTYFTTWGSWQEIVTGTKQTSFTDSTTGAIMGVGSFGLGGIANAPIIANMDTTASLQSGFFRYVSGTTLGTKPTGSAANGSVFVERYNSTSVVKQTWTDVVGGAVLAPRTWIRTSNAVDTWGSWLEVAMTASPALTGVPTAPTAAVGTNTTQVATTAFVNANAAIKDSDTGSVKISAGTTAQRTVAPTYGCLRANSTLNSMEWWNGVVWSPVGAGATGAGSDDIFYENSQVITTNYTLTTGKNAMTAGPITINTGVTVTIPTGQTWSIV